MGRARNRSVAVAADPFASVMGTRRGIDHPAHELRPLPDSSDGRRELWANDGALAEWSDTADKLALVFAADGDLPRSSLVMYDMDPNGDEPDFNFVLTQDGPGVKNADSSIKSTDELASALERAWVQREPCTVATSTYNPITGKAPPGVLTIEPDEDLMGYYFEAGGVRVPVSENEMSGVVHWAQQYCKTRNAA